MSTPFENIRKSVSLIRDACDLLDKSTTPVTGTPFEAIDGFKKVSAEVSILGGILSQFIEVAKADGLESMEDVAFMEQYLKLWPTPPTLLLTINSIRQSILSIKKPVNNETQATN